MQSLKVHKTISPTYKSNSQKLLDKLVKAFSTQSIKKLPMFNASRACILELPYVLLVSSEVFVGEPGSITISKRGIYHFLGDGNPSLINVFDVFSMIVENSCVTLTFENFKEQKYLFSVQTTESNKALNL